MPAVCHFLIVCVLLTVEQSIHLDDGNVDAPTPDNSNISTLGFHFA